MPELTRRYVVMAMATEAPFERDDPEGVFVLKPWKDPAALRALRTYAENCYPELARELERWIRTVERGPVVRGDVGQRNERHLRGTATSTRGAAARRATLRKAAAKTTRAPRKRRR